MHSKHKGLQSHVAGIAPICVVLNRNRKWINISKHGVSDPKFLWRDLGESETMLKIQKKKKMYSLTCWFLQWVFVKHLLLLGVRKCKGPRVKRRMALSRDWEEPGGCRGYEQVRRGQSYEGCQGFGDLNWGRRSGWLLYFTSNVSCIT